MRNEVRQYSLIDQLAIQLQQGLQSVFGVSGPAERLSPAKHVMEQDMSPSAKKHSAGLMRVNHVGEVCAQALYQGQAITARSKKVRNSMKHAAREEVDHLAWCAQRLKELDSQTSYLNPVWYLGALTIGVCAGVAGDKWSLGFMAETERQVCAHLKSHLNKLPVKDHKSRYILEQMIEDEAQHATMAVESGAKGLPVPVKEAMRVASKVMTTVAYYL